MSTGRERTHAALAGAQVQPVAAGLTFVPAEVLVTGAGGPGPAAALVETCTRAGLDFAFVPSWEPWAAQAVEGLLGAGVATLWVVPGVLWPALDVLGVAEGLKATASDPSALTPLLDEAAERGIAGVARASSLGADAVVAADDLAGASGLLVSPDFALEALVPRLGQVASAASDAGLPCVLHSDGDTRSLVSAVAGVGFSALHAGGLATEVFERLFWQARAAGLTVLGGVSAAECAAGLPAAVRCGTRLGILAAAGGLIVADDGGTVTREQFAALMAAIAAARG